MKYAVIVTYTTGERTGATVTASGCAAAWDKVFEMFDSWANISVRMGAPDSTVRNWYDKAVLCLGEALDEVQMAEELLERASRARTY